MKSTVTIPLEEYEKMKAKAEMNAKEIKDAANDSVCEAIDNQLYYQMECDDQKNNNFVLAIVLMVSLFVNAIAIGIICVIW